jgi:hypothetical protein
LQQDLQRMLDSARIVGHEHQPAITEAQAAIAECRWCKWFGHGSTPPEPPERFPTSYFLTDPLNSRNHKGFIFLRFFLITFSTPSNPCSRHADRDFPSTSSILSSALSPRFYPFTLPLLGLFLVLCKAHPSFLGEPLQSLLYLPNGHVRP